MNCEASHSSLSEETSVNKITTAMEKEETAIHEETCKEQQQIMVKVDGKFLTTALYVSVILASPCLYLRMCFVASGSHFNEEIEKKNIKPLAHF